MDKVFSLTFGRENKFSAEIFAPAISPIRMQREMGVVLIGEIK
jgi:hypothetical protein